RLGKKKIVSFANPFHRYHSSATIYAAPRKRVSGKDERRCAIVTLGSTPALRNHLAMGDAAISVRLAKPDDADGVARVYIESWHDTYAAILPMRLLCAMTPRGQTARWRSTVRSRGERVFVAEDDTLGVVGVASC